MNEIIKLEQLGYESRPITYSRTDYPKGLGDMMITGFDTFEEATKLAEENDLEVHLFQTRDGWTFWHDKGKCYTPLTIDDYVSDLGDNAGLVENDLGMFDDIIKHSDSYEEIEDLKAAKLELQEELNAVPSDHTLIWNGHSDNREVIANEMMSYHSDVYTYSIGLLYRA